MADAPKIVFDNYDCTITDVKMPVPNLYVFKCQLPPGKQINFIAGQYVSWMVPNVGPAPFSIASSPADTTALELSIELTGGPHTSVIKQAKVGDHCVLRGPFGNFVIGTGEKRIAFLAGGVGITPFMSMLRWIRDTKQDIKATLFWSCRTIAEFTWIDEIEAMQRECPNIRVVFTVTREDPPGWQHYKGRINEAMIRGKLPDSDETVFYSCGPPALIDAMFAILKTMGVPDERLKKEKW